MNIKYKTLAIFFAVAIIAAFSSCNKVEKPTISVLEIGLNNSRIAYIGADLHIEAEIVAEGTIDKITVEIHKEDGTGEEIEAKYDEFSGLKNTTFHKHVDIPETTVAGTYHCHITVIDMKGNSTTEEEEITIKKLVDNEAPALTVSSAPTNGQTFTNGQTITISGSATDNISLAGLFVALVYEDDNISDDDVLADNSHVIVMLHTHDFGDDPDEADFSASIVVGATNDNNITPAPIQGDNAWKSGNYYILVKSKDEMGNWVISNHYPILISL